MLLALVCSLCLCQMTGSIDSPDRMEREIALWQGSQAADQAAVKQKQKREATYEEQQFINKFNHLVGVLEDFAKKYNEGRTVDLKKVKAVKKAWRDLEKSDMWFRLDENSGH